MSHNNTNVKPRLAGFFFAENFTNLGMREAVVEIFFDRYMTNLIGGFYDFADIVGNFIKRECFGFKGLELAQHFVFEEFI